MSKKEREICEFENRNEFKEFFFCLRSNLSNTNIRLGLKTGLENDIFRSEIGSGLGEPGGTPPTRISRRSTPRGETEQKVLFFAMRLFNLISTNICSRKN